MGHYWRGPCSSSSGVSIGSGLSYGHGDEMVKAKSRKCYVLCSILSLPFQRQLCFSQTYSFQFMISLGTTEVAKPWFKDQD